jgi:hypothetical protein
MFKFEIFDEVYAYTGEDYFRGKIIARTEWLDGDKTYLVAGVINNRLSEEWHNEDVLHVAEEE